MNFGIDESKVLYGLGALLGVISIIYFGHELILGLSPTVKSLILFSVSAIFLVSGDLIDNKLLKTSVSIFSGFAYIVFLTYAFAKFNFSQVQTFTLLAGSSAAFTGLGYLRSEEIFSLNSGRSKKIITALAVLVVISIGFDVTGGQPEYQLDLKDKVEVTEGEQFSAGMLRVENNFPLSRNIDLPRYDGCIAFNSTVSENLYVHPDGEGIIRGGENLEFNLTEEVYFRGPQIEQAREEIVEKENRDISANYKVKNQECPDDLENQTIYITAEEDSSSILRRSSTENID